jgi:hypothetical protein
MRVIRSGIEMMPALLPYEDSGYSALKTEILLLLFFVSIFDVELILSSMKLSSDQKTRVIVVLALILGWLAVFFLRSGTSWG